MLIVNVELKQLVPDLSNCNKMELDPWVDLEGDLIVGSWENSTSSG